MTKTDVLTYLKAHKAEFEEKYGVTSIGLFGSFSRNEQTEKSDIDVVIEMASEHKSLSTFFAIKRTIEHDLHRDVDLGIESTLKPIVKSTIAEEIIYV